MPTRNKPASSGAGFLTSRYSAVVWLAIYLVLQIGAHFLSPPLHSLIARRALVLLSAAFFIFLALAVCASLTAAIRRPGPAALMLAIGVAGLAALIGLSAPLAQGASIILLLLQAARELCLILAAVGLGILLACGIRDRNILLPAAVFAAFADFLVVNYAGAVHWALTSGAKGQKALNAMSAHVPAFHPGLPVLTVGLADFLFLSIFFACVHRFGLRLKATFALFLLFLTLSLWFVALEDAPIPALAPMALAFVLANFRCFKLSREELQAMAAAAVIVLVAALVLILRRPHPSHAPPSKSAQKASALFPLDPLDAFNLTPNA